MAHLASRRTRALALPVGLALIASLGFLPATTATATARTDGPKLSYVVNTRSGHAAVRQVERAVEQAGGTVVISYEQIGVIVAHSQNPAFGETIRRVRGVHSAGATRTNPIVPQATKDVGALSKPLTEGQAATAAARSTADEDPLEPLQWSLPAIKADKAHQKSLGSKRVTVAVIDTGVDVKNPQLTSAVDVEAGKNFLPKKLKTEDGREIERGKENGTTDTVGHGTKVAGIIAAREAKGTGFTGLAPGATIIPIQQNDADGNGTAQSLADAIRYAADTAKAD
ncbi:S8 family serine peptidase, partial [Streptomyces halstedii]|uniref:S8 family serine peptidase n=1 Tax=Streptomyces halstedii TaxID=1944 RepID=UPI0033A4CE2F